METDMTHVYRCKHRGWGGRPCRILKAHRGRALIQFDDGEQEQAITVINCLRRDLTR